MNHNRDSSSVSLASEVSSTSDIQAFQPSLEANTGLTRLPTRYDESVCYPGQEKDEIELKRVNTRIAILNTLERRLTGIAHEDITQEAELGREMYRTNTNALNEGTLPTKDEGAEFVDIDPELITWDGPDDPENPINWPPRQKFINMSIVSLYAFCSPFASSILSPAVSKIAEDFHEDNQVIQSLTVSIFLLAFSIGPMFISAPISEMYGRKYIMDLSCWFMFFFQLGCAFSKTSAQMIVCRFFAGLGGATPLAIGAGTLSDMFSGPGKYGTAKRPIAMSLFSIGPCAGPTLSTLISGYIVQYAGWRWVFYVMCIVNFCVCVYGTVFFKETYAPTLLLKKKNRLVKETGNTNLQTIYEIADLETPLGRLQVNITRPIKLLFTHPMVMGLGLYMAICYGLLYIFITAFPSVWRGVYHHSTGNSGLFFISLLLGYFIGIAFWGKATVYIYKTLTARNNGVPKPEFRLPSTAISSLLLGIGLFWFGWGVDNTHRKHPMMWFFPEVGAFIFAFGLIAMFQSVQTFLVDMNPRFSASSIAAAAFFRSLFGFAFPLFSPYMFQNVGYGVGCSIFGAIALVVGLPFPLYLFYNGERLRNWANRRMEASQAKRDAKNLERLKKQNDENLERVLNHYHKTNK